MLGSVSSKRDVKECVKSVLQPFVEDDSIETEDLKAIIKSTSDVLTPPVSVSSVERHALQELLVLLRTHDGRADLVERVQSLLQEREENESPTITQGGDSATGAESESAALGSKPSGFTFGALKERLAKKREVLKTARDNPSATSPAVQAREAPGKVVAEMELPASGDGADLPLSASTAADDAPKPVATAAALPSTSDGDEPSSLRQAPGGEPPALKREKTEALGFSASPLEEEDLYADLPLPSRGRASVWRGRGVGRGAPRGFPRGGAPPYWQAPYRGGYTHAPPPPTAGHGMPYHPPPYM